MDPRLRIPASDELRMLREEKVAHRRTSALLQNILDTTPTSIFWKDADRRFLGANRAFLDFYGFESDAAIIGRNDEDMGWHRNPGPYRDDELRVIEEGVSTSRVPGRCMVGDENRYIVASKSPMYEDGRVVGLVGSFEDVTEETLHMQEIDRLNEELKVALDEAEKASMAESQFLSSMSHDMRTPLNGIIGFTELALHSDDPDKVRDYLDKIRTSGGILNDLVNDTLVMLRVESGKLTLSPVPCMNLELLDGIREPVRVLAEGKGVVYTDNVDLIPPRRIMADRVNTQKILLNLLSNAVKFTPEGGHVDFHISLDPPGSAEPDSILTVSDTGIGMDPDFLERAFEPFTQEDPGNAGRMGTGLGLSIVKSLVDAMGGRIEVTSSRGGGTVFTVRLHFPAAPAVAESPVPASGDDPGCRRALAGGSVPAAGRDADGTPAPDDVVASAVRRAPAGTRRVLVAEDNHLNAEISRALLEREGLEVTLVEDGRQAVEAFMESPVDSFAAVLLDLRMPVMDGESAARAIRALDRPDAGTIPVIAVSADAYPENIQRCVAAGMDGHIAKPVVPGELARVLAAHGVPLEEEAL